MFDQSDRPTGGEYKTEGDEANQKPFLSNDVFDPALNFETENSEESWNFFK